MASFEDEDFAENDAEKILDIPRESLIAPIEIVSNAEKTSIYDDIKYRVSTIMFDENYYSAKSGGNTKSADFVSKLDSVSVDEVVRLASHEMDKVDVSAQSIQAILIEKITEVLQIRLNLTKMNALMIRKQEIALMECYTYVNFTLAKGKIAWEKYQILLSGKYRLTAEYQEKQARIKYAALVKDEAKADATEFSTSGDLINNPVLDMWKNRIRTDEIVALYFKEQFKNAKNCDVNTYVFMKWTYRRALNVLNDDLAAMITAWPYFGRVTTFTGLKVQSEDYENHEK